MVMAIAIFTTTTAAVRPRKRSAASFTRPLYYLARSAALFLSLFLLFVKKFWFWVSKLFSVMCGGKKRGFDRSCIDFCDCYLVLWMEWLLKRCCRQPCDDEEAYRVVRISTVTVSDLQRSLLFAVALPGVWYVGGDGLCIIDAGIGWWFLCMFLSINVCRLCMVVVFFMCYTVCW